jgi:mannose-6-phosphate isomerase-like protein (cupin superfamily)
MRSRGLWLPDGRKSEANVIKSRNADVEAVPVSAVEGEPLYGGDMLVKPLIKGDGMTFLEIHMRRESTPRFTPTRMKSIAYVVKGKVKSTVGSAQFIIGPGDVCRHPKGVLHGSAVLQMNVMSIRWVSVVGIKRTCCRSHRMSAIEGRTDLARTPPERRV